MTRREAEELVGAFDEYLGSQSELAAACDGPNDKRIVRHRKCRERLLRLLTTESISKVHTAKISLT